MIYSRTGVRVRIIPKRLATHKDFLNLINRNPDERDNEILKQGEYIVATREDGKERLYVLSSITADNPHKELYPLLNE